MAEVARHMETFCFNNFGCRVVLKLYDIMAITDEAQIQYFADSYIERNVQRMMVDQNANYIIQKIIFLQHYSKIDFITDLLIKDVGPLFHQTIKLCENPYACRVLQRLVLKVRSDKVGWSSPARDNLRPAQKQAVQTVLLPVRQLLGSKHGRARVRYRQEGVVGDHRG